MSNKVFSFYTPTKVLFGEGVSKNVGIELKQRGHKKVLIVTDVGIEKAGILTKCHNYLTQSDLKVVIYKGIRENPTEDNVHEGCDLILKEKVDAVLALGGGSPIDAAKAMSMLSVHGGSILEYEYGLSPITAKGPEIYIVPTTAGTGSEVTFWSVITDQNTHRKFDVGSPLMASSVSFVDPEMTYSLPPLLTAATGMDALCHAIEAYTTKNASEITDALVLRAVELISKNLIEAFNNGINKDARYRVMLGSTTAGLAFPNAGLGAVHGLTAPLGGYFNIPHGIANAIMLPIVMEFNKPTAEERYATIAKAFGIKNASAEAAIEHVKKMNDLMKIPSLTAFNPDTSIIGKLATDALGRNSNCNSNPREVSQNDAQAMYKSALNI